MDNVAHTLVGAAIGRAVGGPHVPRAGWLGAVAANTPDLAELLTVAPWPRVQHLALHRGITHSLLGTAVETAALAAIVAVAAHWRARRRGRAATPAIWILAVVAAAMASHPFMDWQGSYGLRPFLPWDGTWYYGDFVAIVDPWYWLLPLISLGWGERRHWLPLAAGLAIWLPTIKRALRSQALRRFGPQATWAALTIPGRPFVWGRLLAGPDTVAGPGWAVPRHLDVPVVQRALRETDGGRAISAFARFLAADVDSSVAPATVYLRDMRYAPPGGGRDGWATVTVRVP